MSGGIRGQGQKKAPGSSKRQAKKPKTDPESVTEDERSLFRSHSQATFSAIIGLSCGALLIMIIIVVAMAMRRTRPSNRTKTVLVDADGDGATEKSHLINMQENGYENPTYKFYDY
ncbi:amyloid-beta precursor-like protein [Acropora millepora]|nr:amyloid-beta precursor-like protein [Acropora millepora]